MKKILPACLVALMAVVLSAQVSAADAADNAIPKPASFARYQPMLKDSPFAVASAVAPTETPNFAKDLYIANAAKSPDGGFVTIASATDKDFKEYLSTAEPVHGYKIANIDWSDRVGETKVTIAKDGQVATLTFNQSVLSQPLPNAAPPQINPTVANRPGQRQYNTIRPAPIPMLPTPAPHVRGVIPRNPGSYVTPPPRPGEDQE